MPRFFYDPAGPHFCITGEDAAHIANSLRMRPGEELTVCDGKGTDYHCRIVSVSPGEVALEELERGPASSEPGVSITLFQGLPKGDKFDWIVQKAVELGATRIVPVAAARSISRPDAKSAGKRREREQKIALEAAEQCGRGIIPEVAPLTGFSDAVAMLKALDTSFFCYELGGASLQKIPVINKGSAGFFIGPEGGIADEEAAALQNAQIPAVTLGPRILRTETAPLMVLSVLLFASGNLEA